MKRIILGLSLLLILVQNGFAISDAEFDKSIKNSTGYMKQNIKCEKEVRNHLKDGNIQECLKAVNMMKKAKNQEDKKHLANETFNLAFMYDVGIGDKLKAYKYYMEAAKLGDTTAQRNLDIMCKESPWACKQ